MCVWEEDWNSDLRAILPYSASPRENRGEPCFTAVVFTYLLFLRTQKVIRKQVSTKKEGDHRERI